LDGGKLSSNAATEWSGTVAELRRKQEKLAEKLKQVLAQPQATDKEGAEAPGTDGRTERDKSQAQVKRLAHQAARSEGFVAASGPKRGKHGHEVQSNVTDNDSAKMHTAHGVLQGYNSQALVDAKHQVIVHAEAFGKGQDHGHVRPMLEGAKESPKAMGLGEEYFVDKILSAESNYHSDENLRTGAQEQLDAYSPDPHFRQRDPRFATQARHQPPTDEKVDEKFTVADFTCDPEQGGDRCPAGKVLKLKARRHRIKHLLYGRYEAKEADCRGCVLREQCLQSPKTRRKHLAVLLEQVAETLSEEMSAKIDTPAAREIYGQRLAIVEPVFGNLRSQKRLDRFPLRGKLKVNIQWTLYCMVHKIEKLLHYGDVMERRRGGGLQLA
jgi:Transposase DDE domain